MKQTLTNFEDELRQTAQELDFVNADLAEQHRAAYLFSERAKFLLELATEQLAKANQALSKPPRGA